MPMFSVTFRPNTRQQTEVVSFAECPFILRARERRGGESHTISLCGYPGQHRKPFSSCDYCQCKGLANGAEFGSGQAGKSGD